MIQPQEINSINFFWDAFPTMNGCIAAIQIVRFCQDRGEGWEPFSREDLYHYVVEMGKGGDFTFNHLVGGTPEKFLVYHQGKYSVTEEFVDRCHNAVNFL